jgi:hypothetical protein
MKVGRDRKRVQKLKVRMQAGKNKPEANNRDKKVKVKNNC